MHARTVPTGWQTRADIEWRRRVAHAFSRAAPRYVELASAQQTMGESLWRRLPPRAGTVLDLGCGPGHWTARLSQRYQRCAIGLDLAPGMLIEAQQRHGRQGHWLCGDATALPLNNRSIELVFSNLAIQWCCDHDALFAELYRVLMPGGRALLNTLVPGTLNEVSYAWCRPDQSAAVRRFTDTQTLIHAARCAGFEADAEQAARRFHYPDIAAVMASIKGIGAQTARAGARLTRRHLAQATRRYEALRENAGLPVTYQCLTLDLTKPERKA
ncbi:methyltransferase domain-containing protein [Halomonas sp. HP20-15]|uniref:methyltransferase domain-containing protein n=1 Tax=Halomonas sp. HP20-15 TaxID=3085901 RepID=UPI002981AC76|nr:methyltransferase domain-containing protein [Halomonas sp. HP20-15]MDW5376858.1 methyltransferase domain-containing protein [Halomonas sp. HP20-15]